MKSVEMLVQANRPRPMLIACSLTDELARLLSVPVCFFYKRSVAHHILTDALSEALSEFPIFAGTLTYTSDRLCIDCNNQGIPFTVTHSTEQTIDQLVAVLPDVSMNELVDVLDAPKTLLQKSAVMTVKLTYFPCGGMALGICWHHAIGDMQSFMQLIKAWCSIVNQRSFSKPLIVNDRQAYLEENIKPNHNTRPGVRHISMIDALKLAAYMPYASKNKRGMRFYFTENEIENMRTHMSGEVGKRLSKNDVICAHMFKSITELDDYTPARYLSLAVNYRSKENLPSTVLGNLISTLDVLVDRNVGVSELAQHVRNGVDHFQRDHMNLYATKAYIKQRGGIGKSKRFLGSTIDPLNRAILVTNWSNFGIYDTVFGDASPFYFCPFSSYPFSWIAVITDGIANDGLIYAIDLPGKLAQKMNQPENLKKIHRFRRAEDVVSVPNWMV